MIIFCLHRSGSSFTTNLLKLSGMSIGNFKTSGGTPTNKYGKFEAHPFLELNKYFQNQIYGYPDDIPNDRLILESLKNIDIDNIEIPKLQEDKLNSARKFIEELTGYSRVSGCKDPRMALTWPVWKDVLSHYDNIIIYPIILVRSPHEIAMSIFSRSKGLYSYEDCLDVIYVSYRMLLRIVREFDNKIPIICFGSPVYKTRMKKIINDLGLFMNDDIFNMIYDPDSVHNKYARINHPSQKIFDQFDTGMENISEEINMEILNKDQIKRKFLLSEKGSQSLNSRNNENLFEKMKKGLAKYFF